MEKKNIDWSSIGFAYMPTDYRYVSNFLGYVVCLIGQGESSILFWCYV